MEFEPRVTEPIRPKFRLKWDIFIGIVLIHLGVIFAPSTFSWPAFWVAVALQWITGAFGITLCFHRLLTHRSFRVPKWLEYTLTVFGTLAMQGGPIKWVATHRVHHAYSDRENDPHSPNKGFWWAHMFWLFAFDDVLDHPDKYWTYAPDLYRDKAHRWIEKTNIFQTLALAGLLFALGGWSFVVWGIFVRTVFVWHCTWLVNSASHIWGYQSYNTNEGSRNNWIVAFLSYGEGWHNNHHAFPTSAAHGLRWWEADITYATIRLLALLGLADQILLPAGQPAKMPPLRADLPARLRANIPRPIFAPPARATP